MIRSAISEVVEVVVVAEVEAAPLGPTPPLVGVTILLQVHIARIPMSTLTTTVITTTATLVFTLTRITTTTVMPIMVQVLLNRLASNRTLNVLQIWLKDKKTLIFSWASSLVVLV